MSRNPPPAPNNGRLRVASPVATEAPLVTVAIPAYNRPALLGEALASLAAQEGFPNFEVLVCDDLGLPGTRMVIAASGLPNLRHEVNPSPLGAVGNWNRCLIAARSPWVTVLHEDDTLYPWFLATVAPRLRPGVAAVAMRCVHRETPPSLEPPKRPPAARVYRPHYFLKGSMTPFPGVVMRRDLALRLGGFDERLGPLADYGFWYALARAGIVELLRAVGAFYRIGTEQWTRRAWPQMLRGSHLLRLRFAREQLPASPQLGRWLARYQTGRMARNYRRRFPGEQPAALARAERFQRMPLAWLPSGWVWRFLQLLPLTALV